MDETVLVKDIMTDKVFTVAPETPILDGIKLLIAHSFNGLPVVDKDKKLVGLVTEYNLIADMFSQGGKLQEQLKRLESIKTKDVMVADPLTLYFDNTFGDALKLFSDHHRINPVPVIDHDNRLVGIVSRFDLIQWHWRMYRDI